MYYAFHNDNKSFDNYCVFEAVISFVIDMEKINNGEKVYFGSVSDVSIHKFTITCPILLIYAEKGLH